VPTAMAHLLFPHMVSATIARNRENARAQGFLIAVNMCCYRG
jgi:hypothetical protein